MVARPLSVGTQRNQSLVSAPTPETALMAGRTTPRCTQPQPGTLPLEPGRRAAWASAQQRLQHVRQRNRTQLDATVLDVLLR